MDPDLIKVTEIFLIPNSFLVAALGTSDSNLHRSGVALLGLIVSLLWLLCSHEAGPKSDAAAANAARSTRTRVLIWMPLFFISAWLIAGAFHFWLWASQGRPLPGP